MATKITNVVFKILLFVLTIFLRILGQLPFTFRSILGKSLGSLFGLFAFRDREFAKLQLEKFYKESNTPKIYRIFGSLGENFLETINLKPVITRSDKTILCDDWEIINYLKTKETGFVALSGHIGNWDLLAAFVVKNGVNLSVIGREARSNYLQGILSKIRETYGVKTLWRRKGSITKAVINEIKLGGGVAALIDQDTRVSGTMSNFFGHPVHTPSTMISLAVKLEIPIIAAFAVREGLSKYRIIIRKIDQTAGVTSATSQFNSFLEEIIKKYPEQWVWFHKRWRTTLEGHRMSSKEYREYLNKI